MHAAETSPLQKLTIPKPIISSLCMMSGFCLGVNETLALVGCYAVQACSKLQMVRNNLLVPCLTL